MQNLPIHANKSLILEHLGNQPLILSAPTGSGKSTEVPRWCPRPVLVVEPRKIACRSLANRVAHLEKTRLGHTVGYHVKDENCSSAQTEIIFVTPGIAIQNLRSIRNYKTVVIDEFHERTIEIDLLTAYLSQIVENLVVMSATLDGESIAKKIRGRYLAAEGRTFPVDIQYDNSGPTIPTTDQLASRCAKIIRTKQKSPGDILVFLPGKAEIGATKRLLKDITDRQIIELHSSLTPKQQNQIFSNQELPKIILSTNVAETSITVPGVRTVIDSGLVRQPRYHQGRSALTLLPIARDSADQRAGRAGRVAPGVCIRLWKPNAHLSVQTTPEIYRSSLVSLVLATKVHNMDMNKLPWVDTPKEHAIQDAETLLLDLGALDSDKKITPRGLKLFRLPIDPWFGRLLIEAENSSYLSDMIDLVSGLSINQPLFSEHIIPDEDQIESIDIFSDISSIVSAVRNSRPGPNIRANAHLEAYQQRKRLYEIYDKKPSGQSKNIPSKQLTELIVKAHPNSAYIARKRGNKIVWANGGTEVHIDKYCRLNLIERLKKDPSIKNVPEPQAIVVLGLRAMREGTKTQLLATSTSPILPQSLAKLGLGTKQITETYIDKEGSIKIQVSQVYAGRSIATSLEDPKEDLLIEAIGELIKSGKILPGLFGQVKQRLITFQLVEKLIQQRLLPKDVELELIELMSSQGHQNASEYITTHLKQLGLESAEDWKLLDEDDLLPPELPFHIKDKFDSHYPQEVDLGDSIYRVEYDVQSRQAILYLRKGNKKTAPPRSYLPKFPGFRVLIQAGGTLHPYS